MTGKVKDDQFAKLPQRLMDALLGGELNYTEFSVLVFLVMAVERNWKTVRATYTLAALAKALDWPHTPDYLHEILGSLRDERWIDYETRPGRKAPYIFRLTGAKAMGAPARSEITSASPGFEADVIPFDSPSSAARKIGVVRDH